MSDFCPSLHIQKPTMGNQSSHSKRILQLFAAQHGLKWTQDLPAEMMASHLGTKSALVTGTQDPHCFNGPWENATNRQIQRGGKKEAVKTPPRTGADTMVETSAHSQLWPSAHLLTVTKKIGGLGCPSYLHRQHDSMEEEVLHYSVNSENKPSSCTLLFLPPTFEIGLGHCFYAHRLNDWLTANQITMKLNEGMLTTAPSFQHCYKKDVVRATVRK